jgi:hypothetical protein
MESRQQANAGIHFFKNFCIHTGQNREDRDSTMMDSVVTNKIVKFSGIQYKLNMLPFLYFL